MRTTNILYRLTFFAGCVILLIGIYLKYNDAVSQGRYVTKYGTRMHTETIDGNGTIVLGVLVLLFSWWINGMYQSRKAEREKQIAQENDPSRKKENRYWSIPPQRKR